MYVIHLESSKKQIVALTPVEKLALVTLILAMYFVAFVIIAKQFNLQYQFFA